jgi:hypothetical protein
MFPKFKCVPTNKIARFVFSTLTKLDPVFRIIFEPPGSVSGSFHQRAKNLDFICFANIVNDLLSLKSDVNVPTESNKQKKLAKKTYVLFESESH